MVVGSGVGGLVLAAGVPLTATAAGVTPDVGSDDAVAPTSLADRAARGALPLPHRPVGGLATAATPRPAPAPAVAPRPDADAPVVVRPGDTLWALASRHLLAPDASDGQVDAAWRRLYAANRAVLGPDPDLIRPGSRLDLPAPAPTEGHP
ncbi:LysM peptidoglycan-binding domain-containing protein [Nocardioides sp. HDW12B]|nr:LysM peptidoglycan-binding domain-containing protein [Nocardioides sp. HDW12B]